MTPPEPPLAQSVPPRRGLARAAGEGHGATGREGHGAVGGRGRWAGRRGAGIPAKKPMGGAYTTFGPMGPSLLSRSPFFNALFPLSGFLPPPLRREKERGSVVGRVIMGRYQGI